MEKQQRKAEKKPKGKVLHGYEYGSWQRLVDELRLRFGIQKGQKTPVKFYLKLCAHCKGKPEAIPGTKQQKIRCRKCGATVPGKTMQEAADKWNMRGGKKYATDAK